MLKALKQALPNTRINKEYYVNYDGQKLFFDFHVPSLNIVIEVQGVQHTEFNKHFHGSAENFKASKNRDRMKSEWCDINDITLVSVNHDEIPISIDSLLHKIEVAQSDG